MKRIISYILMALAVLVSCEQEQPEQQLGVSDIDNPRQDKTVARFGETVSVTFIADAAWEAELVLIDGEGWAEIVRTLGQDAAGKGTVRVKVKKNEADVERSAELLVSVAGGKSELIASFTQAAGDATSAMSAYLNEYMHNILTKDYLWADAYNELEVDKSVTYDKFLYTNLTKLGDLNIEDGGYYRDYSSSAGERYIYSNISEVASTKSSVVTKAGELASVYGLGIGPLFASLLEEGTDYIGLTVGYVYSGSPAEVAGLRRGDTIYGIGNTRITKSNYQSYMNELFSSPSGTYSLSFARYVPDEEAERYELDVNNTVTVTTDVYGYSPLLYAAVLQGTSSGTEYCIGYMATESFDSSAQEVLDYQIQQFIDAGITDLILDLRYNIGGEVQQSRYLASSIVGREYDNDVFLKVEFNDGRREEWKFLSGPAESDMLGKAPDMNLCKLYVIMSENTASASELIIAGLNGVDFPVVLIGSQSEGKNVGMEVTQEIYNGRRFQFAPITYRVLNAKDEYGPKDGFEPDSGNLLNNQNKSYGDDIDNIFPYSFGDWDNFDFNIALNYCFCDILGMQRPDLAMTRSGESGSLAVCARNIQNAVVKFDASVLQPELGRFGNVIYR